MRPKVVGYVKRSADGAVDSPQFVEGDEVTTVRRRREQSSDKRRLDVMWETAAWLAAFYAENNDGPGSKITRELFIREFADEDQ
jgi:hypothetical protein